MEVKANPFFGGNTLGVLDMCVSLKRISVGAAASSSLGTA
jgi:hypothetical protein